MTVDAHDEAKPADTATLRQYRVVAAPRRNEGISNALRAAFHHDASALPAEVERLLRQLS